MTPSRATFLGVQLLVALAQLLLAAAPRQGAEAQQWWSHRPLVAVAVPDVDDPTHWCRNDIDRFILARMAEDDLKPAGEASDLTLLRRASFDLTGLPPTPEAVARWQGDSAPERWSNLVGSLLASPQYGVRWGRHWLDLVRWAETDGYERDRAKPGAWRYRDWVIAAFNDDLPYDQFLQLQLAGDELPQPTIDSLVATGFLHLGIRDDEPTDPERAYYDDIDGMVDTTSRVMLGMAMGCVRCHDHKRDPIPQSDYYRMAAFFRGLKPYRSGGGNSIATGNFVRHVPSDMGAEGEDPRAIWKAQRLELAQRAEALVGKSLAGAGAGDRPQSALEAVGLPAAGLLRHEAFEGDSTLCEQGVSGMALLVRSGGDSRRIERPVQDDFTISFHFRPDADGSGEMDEQFGARWFLGQGLVDGEVPGITNDFGISWFSGGRVCAGIGNPETFLSSAGGLETGVWHHVALTRSRASGEVALFVDGELVAEAVAGRQALSASPQLSIGMLHTGVNPLRGAIDEVRIYDRALDEREVLALSDGAAFGPAAGQLIAGQSGADAAAALNEVAQQRLAMRAPVVESIEVLCAQEVPGAVEPTHVLARGNPDSPLAQVEPGFPTPLGGGEAIIAAAAGQSSGRRTALARWITDPANIRTARVMVNRIWQHHFGRAICRDPNDFGKLGEEPTHPELLDWLALRFIESGWSVKAMHRLIMDSASYRMGWSGDAGFAQTDSANDTFWRFDTRRLSGEEIRDSVLAANGSLNLKLGGPSVFPPIPAEVLATASRPEEAWGDSSDADDHRRSAYIFVKRSLQEPLLASFDQADTDGSCPVRFTSIQPTQALTMVNGEFAQEQSRAFARRLRQECGSDDAACVARSIALALSRSASASEIKDGMAFIDQMQRQEGLEPDQALSTWCLLVYNLNEFAFVD